MIPDALRYPNLYALAMHTVSLDTSVELKDDVLHIQLSISIQLPKCIANLFK